MLSKKLELTPYTHFVLSLWLFTDSYLRTTQVTWIEVGKSLGLDEME
jgi:hypothetical protein